MSLTTQWVINWPLSSVATRTRPVREAQVHILRQEQRSHRVYVGFTDCLRKAITGELFMNIEIGGALGRDLSEVKVLLVDDDEGCTR
jgi:hypothetical protein